MADENQLSENKIASKSPDSLGTNSQRVKLGASGPTFNVHQEFSRITIWELMYSLSIRKGEKVEAAKMFPETKELHAMKDHSSLKD